MIVDLSTETTNAYATQISTASLGDHSYIVVVGGRAVAIDIQRDLDRFEDVLTGIDATLVAVLETHIHNDYVSGGKRLADLHDAEYVLPANTGAPYPHHPLPDGESIAVGEWKIRAMHTPGHTFNHTSYVLEAPEGPVAIFTGGSMLVGAVGRSDLLGPDHTDALLAHQFASAHRIADSLPEPSLVAPTHGTGSFCSASDVADTTSTVGLEKQRNPALLAPNVEVFATSQVLGYKAFPAYYRYMAPSNLTPLGAAPESPLPVVASLAEIDGAAIADVRPFAEFAAGHLPGSISVPLSNDTAVYLGWTLAGTSRWRSWDRGRMSQRPGPSSPASVGTTWSAASTQRILLVCPMLIWRPRPPSPGQRLSSKARRFSMCAMVSNTPTASFPRPLPCISQTSPTIPGATSMVMSSSTARAATAPALRQASPNQPERTSRSSLTTSRTAQNRW